MSVLTIVGGILLIIASVIVVVSVALQETKGGLGSLSGGNNSSFFEQNRGKTREAMLARASKFGGAALMILALLVLAAHVYL